MARRPKVQELATLDERTVQRVATGEVAKLETPRLRVVRSGPVKVKQIGLDKCDKRIQQAVRRLVGKDVSRLKIVSPECVIVLNPGVKP